MHGSVPGIQSGASILRETHICNHLDNATTVVVKKLTRKLRTSCVFVGGLTLVMAVNLFGSGETPLLHGERVTKEIDAGFVELAFFSGKFQRNFV